MGISYSQLKIILDEAEKNHLHVEITPRNLPESQLLSLETLSHLKISVDRISTELANSQNTLEERTEFFLNHSPSIRELPDHVRDMLYDITNEAKSMRAGEASAGLTLSSSRSTLHTCCHSLSDSESSSGLEDLSDSEHNYAINGPQRRS
jgi:hypothetical protein